jgi:hypothetical protein
VVMMPVKQAVMMMVVFNLLLKNDVHVFGSDSTLGNRRKLYLPTLKPEFFQLADKEIFIHSQIQQCRKCHITADSRKTIEIEYLHPNVFL